MHPDSTHLIHTGGMGPSSVSYVPTVSHSTDGGGSWQRRPLTTAGRGYALCTAFTRSEPGLAYTGGHVDSFGVFFRSTDWGNTWVETATSPDDTIYAVAAHPDSVGLVYAATPGGLFRSFDRGESWNSIFDQDARAIALRPGSPDTIVVGGNDGAYVSGDGGETWQETSTGLDPPRVASLAFARTDPVTLFCGTDGGACYRNSSLTGVKEQRAPTPAGPRMSASIIRNVLDLDVATAPGPGLFRVALLSTTGRRVTVLAYGPNDVRHLSPGVYFVRGRGLNRKVVIQR